MEVRPLTRGEKDCAQMLGLDTARQTRREIRRTIVGALGRLPLEVAIAMRSHHELAGWNHLLRAGIVEMIQTEAHKTFTEDQVDDLLDQGEAAFEGFAGEAAAVPESR